MYCEHDLAWRERACEDMCPMCQTKEIERLRVFVEVLERAFKTVYDEVGCENNIDALLTAIDILKQRASVTEQ